jgi:hypothetical protein
MGSVCCCPCCKAFMSNKLPKAQMSFSREKTKNISLFVVFGFFHKISKNFAFLFDFVSFLTYLTCFVCVFHKYCALQIACIFKLLLNFKISDKSGKNLIIKMAGNLENLFVNRLPFNDDQQKTAIIFAVYNAILFALVNY